MAKKLPKKKKPIELRLYTEQFEKILGHVATDVLKLRNLIDVLVRVGVIVKLISSPTIPCQQYTAESPTQLHHDVNEAEAMAEEMHQIQKTVCQEFLSDTDFMQMVNDETSKINDSNAEHRFMGGEIVREVVRRLDEKGLRFCCSYLQSVGEEKTNGKLGLCFIYSCYEPSNVDIPASILDESTLRVSPRRVGGSV